MAEAPRGRRSEAEDARRTMSADTSDASQTAARALEEARKPRIANCKGCGSHFEQVTDETLCGACLKWAALCGELALYRKAQRK